MSDIRDWSTIAENNSKTPPDGWPENMAPSDVNNTARENMAAAKRAYLQSPYMSPGGTVVYVNETTVTIADDDLNTDYSQFYTAQRRVKVLSPTGDKYGLVTSASYSSGVTTVVLQMDGGAVIPTDLTDIMLGIEYNDIANVAGPNMLGMVLPYTAPVDNIPAGFLLADGDYFNPTIYSALADLYDTGEKDESGNIIYLHGGGYTNGNWWPKKPDVRGQFPRFLDNRASTDETKVDPDSPRTVGSRQGYGVGPHSHAFNTTNENGWVRAGTDTILGSAVYASGSNREMWSPSTVGQRISNTNSVAAHESAEARPVNMAFPGLLVAYGGYASASGVKVEDLLDLTIEAATEQINTALAAMEQQIGLLENQVNEAIDTLDERTAEKVAELNAIVTQAEADIDASVALAKQYADHAAEVTVGKQDKIITGTVIIPTGWSLVDSPSEGLFYSKIVFTNSAINASSTVWVNPYPSKQFMDAWAENGVYLFGTTYDGKLAFRAKKEPTTFIMAAYAVIN